MKLFTSIAFALLCNPAIDGLADTQTAGCGNADGTFLQVLGSGGPIADDGRASSGYLIWIDGMSKVLIDAGGGVFMRFGESGASFEDLEHIAISHFHTDHSTNLVALLKSGYFSNRTRALSVSGPAAGGDNPGTAQYLARLLSQDQGAYAYLDGYLDGVEGLVMHMPVPENVSGVGRNLHAPPSVIGKIAAEAGTPKLVLSHFMARSLENMEENLLQIRSRYSGVVLSANDLDCVGM